MIFKEKTLTNQSQSNHQSHANSKMSKKSMQSPEHYIAVLESLVPKSNHSSVEKDSHDEKYNGQSSRIDNFPPKYLQEKQTYALQYRVEEEKLSNN